MKKIALFLLLLGAGYGVWLGLGATSGSAGSMIQLKMEYGGLLGGFSG